MLSKIKLQWPLMRVELDVRIETKDSVSPHRTIDWEPIGAYQELSICASIYRRSVPSDRWRDSAFGQCRGEVREHVAHLEDEAKREALLELLTIWERWHLNGMNAGLRPQRDALRSEARKHPEVLDYNAACKFLEGLGLLTMPATKYTYGSAWLVEVMPQDIINRVKQLCRTLGATVLEAA